ncbi:MAG: hypothetical protein GY798_29930 [Hyphomicrobiales bacterium]|nr:hypothetical protein [Hyphomicrobiales bacterium]
MPTVRDVLITVLALLTPGTAIAQDGQGVSQYRHLPFSGFDLTAIGIVLVIVMVVLGLRALARRRGQRTGSDTD